MSISRLSLHGCSSEPEIRGAELLSARPALPSWTQPTLISLQATAILNESCTEIHQGLALGWKGSKLSEKGDGQVWQLWIELSLAEAERIAFYPR